MEPKLGVKLIAVYYAIGAALLAVIGFAATQLPVEVTTLPIPFAAMGGAILIIIAVLMLAVAYGIYALESWGWYLAMLLNVLVILNALMSMAILSLIIPAIIIWYLWTNQRDFGVRMQK